MKRSLLFFAFIGFAINLGAQCVPNNAYVAANVPGVYPRDTTGNNTVIYACQNEPFSFTFTAVVPDSITTPLAIALTSINITGITGRPAGFDYVCNSPDINGQNANDCIFHGPPANQPAIAGCMIMEATAAETAAAAIQQYPLTINTIINGALPINIPGPVLAYAFTIEILAQGDARCNNAHLGVDARSLGDGKLSIEPIMPNPSTGMTYLRIHSTEVTELVFTINNTLGQTVSTTRIPVNSGDNVVAFDASFLSNGMYLFNVTDGQSIVSNKVMIAR